jgi:O-antigen ligase
MCRRVAVDSGEGCSRDGIDQQGACLREGSRAVAYFRFAALVTVSLYTAGYSALGFGLLVVGIGWRLLLRRGFPWHSTPLDLPLAVLGAVLVLSAAVSPYRGVAWTVTLLVIASGAVYLGVFTWLLHRDPAFREALLRAWAIGAAGAALLGLANLFYLHRERAAIELPIPGVGPNGLGTTLQLGSVLALGLVFHAPRRERVLWLAAGLVCLVGLVATGSRASWAGWLVGALFLVWGELRDRPRMLVTVVMIGAGVVGLIGILAPQTSTRLRDTLRAGAGDRVRIWHTSVRMIGAHPLLGTGFGTFLTAYERWKDPGTLAEPFAHNLPLNILVEIGLLGLLGGLWVAVVAAREWMRWGRRAPPGADPWRVVVTALWIGLLVEELGDNTLFSISTSAGVWLLLAWLVTAPGTLTHRPSVANIPVGEVLLG